MTVVTRRWLLEKLLEGIAGEVSWNPKTGRFQEYAPNELDPPDFKPKVRNPPARNCY